MVSCPSPKLYSSDSPQITCMCSNLSLIKTYEPDKIVSESCFIKDLQRRPSPKGALTLRFSEKAFSLLSIPGTRSQPDPDPAHSRLCFLLSAQCAMASEHSSREKADFASLFLPAMLASDTPGGGGGLPDPVHSRLYPLLSKLPLMPDTTRGEAEPRTTPK